MSHRLFIGIALPLRVKDLLIDCMEGLDGARWQDEDQLHLTLRFVGDVDAPLANDLAARLRMVAAESTAFPVAIDGVGHFERKKKPHTLWAGLSPSPDLLVLQRKVERVCQLVGLEPETRRFTPHITLARLNSATGPIAPFLANHARLQSPPFMVDHIILYESHLSRNGSMYEAVMRYSLK
ncbi:RNA 2',3'-cyclic phosphodiesterase [Altericroceibacterium spongiae]|uniref:RNA 2',3'-cyclic phosphodiesterase n=1 Tax=Altericroceibacterium spongiae TaxID=2320269 RepID=A0A420ERB1_9SPHN|nr:RNA 2',3'-cyclic phosphodiesterase [Altericroceibacterium spongiae]RKF23222.1 RNA 2',3'-cyclic phosphodiesterase [Altericroceibacterium spongiae]